MTQNLSNMTSRKWLHVLCGLGLLISFFLTWAVWDGSRIRGCAMPAGYFFETAETRFGLGNPYPKLSFTFYVFALIPLLPALIIFLTLTNRKTGWLPFITGTLSLSLVTIFILFTGVLTDLGVGKTVWGMLTIGAWMHAAAAVGLIFSSSPHASLLKRVGWMLVGPVFVFASFKIVEKTILAETYKDTAGIKADFTITADDLLSEFISNDTAANKKYMEKTLVVNGNVSAVDILADSTSTIRFADSTGSYAIFSLEKSELENVKKIKPADPVSVKGVCSGSIFSEILGTTSISFKRATFNKK